MEKKLAVLFPGANYNMDHPLLYYSAGVFKDRGYELLPINYNDNLRQSSTVDELIAQIDLSVMKELKAVEFAHYSDIVFISKSLGTIIAPVIEDHLKISVRHIFLTPVSETMAFLKKERSIIVIVSGTMDDHIDADSLKKHCFKEDIHLVQVEGADHRLEIKGDVNKNIDILKQIIEIY